MHKSSPKSSQAKNWIIASLVLVLWLVASSIAGPVFGKLSNVATNDQSAFLPASADSTKVQNLEPKFLDLSAIPAVIVSVSNTKLSAQQLNDFKPLISQIKQVNGVVNKTGSVIGPVISADHKAVEIVAQIDSNTKASNVVANLRSVVSKYSPRNTTGYVTGPAGLAADLITAFNGIDGTLLYVTLAAVLVVLLFVYRSVILPFIVLITAAFALTLAGFAVYHGVNANWFKLNGESQGILSILVIGAATDYSLLLTSRFREALFHHQSKWEAIRLAIKSGFKPILASGSTVILGLLCLLFSDLNSNRSLGPIGAFGIAFSLLAALTFLPAVLALLGRKAFWPFMPKYNPEHESKNIKTGVEGTKGLWRSLPLKITANARMVWVVFVLALVLAALALPSFKASGVSQSQTILGKSQAVTGQNVLADHFPAGSGSPVLIVVKADKLKQILQSLKSNSDLSQVFPVPAKNSLKPLVVNNQVMIEATLKVAADSTAADKVVTNLRTSLDKIDSSTLVGGTTAISIDTNNTANQDIHRIIPLVLAVVFVVLILLLRALLAPVLLILSVILSYSATIGISALLFNHVFHFPGSDAAIPLFAFIFLVALGVDYNIFLVTRISEESEKIGTKLGIIRGLSVTGSVITSAGVVLAVTFAALSVVPILFLVEIAFIVAFGVLLDTIIVRSLIVPALTYDIGKYIWWPRKVKADYSVK